MDMDAVKISSRTVNAEFCSGKFKITCSHIINISMFCFLFADCLPEKTVQILAEAWEHSREILHHGKPSLSSKLPGNLDGAGWSKSDEWDADTLTIRSWCHSY